MPLIASSEGSGSFQLVPAGSHVARCIWVIDLGTQQEEFQGKPRIQHKCRLGFELPENLAVFSEEKGEEPFFVGKEYTLSLDPKANLRKDLESWRGKQFNEDEAKRFDLEKLLGVPALVTITHGTSGTSKKTYSKITGISPLPRAMTCPPRILDTIFYSVDMGNSDAFKKLPEWIKEKIMESNEWKGDTGPQRGTGTHEADETQSTTTTPF